MKYPSYSPATTLAAKYTFDPLDFTEANKVNEGGDNEALFPSLPSVPKNIY